MVMDVVKYFKLMDWFYGRGYFPHFNEDDSCDEWPDIPGPRCGPGAKKVRKCELKRQGVGCEATMVRHYQAQVIEPLSPAEASPTTGGKSSACSA